MIGTSYRKPAGLGEESYLCLFTQVKFQLERQQLNTDRIWALYKVMLIACLEVVTDNPLTRQFKPNVE